MDNNEMEINDILDPEEMDLVAGGRSLPESIIKKVHPPEEGKRHSPRNCLPSFRRRRYRRLLPGY